MDGPSLQLTYRLLQCFKTMTRISYALYPLLPSEYRFSDNSSKSNVRMFVLIF